LILKMRHVSMIDATGEANLDTFIQHYMKHGGTVLIAELDESPLEILKRSGLYGTIGAHNFFSDTTDAINQALNLIDVSNCHYCQKNGVRSCSVYKQIHS